MTDRPKGLGSILDAMEPVVWLGSAFTVIAFCLHGGLFTESAAALYSSMQGFIAEYFGWFYILSTSILVGFVIWLYFSRFGRIRLGGDDSRPEFSNFAWFTMLFSAGMGIGLVFWGIAEPIMHYESPPVSKAGTQAAMVESMRFTFFHWGLHPWAVYIVFALGIAYYHFRHDLPLAPRSLLYPVIGERYKGWSGHIVDILCTVGTLFGVATSLGLGSMQINAGLHDLTGISLDTSTQIWIIVVITLAATASVVSGIEKGIKLLSQFNILLALGVMAFVFLAGPTLFQLKLFTSTTGDYLQNLLHMSFWMEMKDSASWQKGWTVFYWGWWISWSPFVGIFVARISKGRTIREFVLTVFLAPTLVTFAWLSVFGGSGLYYEMFGGGGISEVVNKDVALSLAALFDRLPWSDFMTAVATLLVVTFFITSSDSGSLVDDMVTSGGHPDPPTAQRVFWAFAEGAVAIVLLYTGGLSALQTASITSGLPIAVLLLFSAYGLVKALRHDVQSGGDLDMH